jgi:nucleotide-binding universal stress UspA family protein
MFKHLLVPLDGSLMAESALPEAARVAARTGALLTLVHVVERRAPSEVHSERHLVNAAEAAAYLAEAARSPTLAGLAVETHVHEAEVRDVARSIAEHTAELAPDLVVMSTHGRGGTRRLVSGTIAQQVTALGVTPVLLVRPFDRPGTAPEWRTILSPVDGDRTHERGLPVAAGLARAFSCRLHLLMVTPTVSHLEGHERATGTLLPGATRMKLEMASAEAEAYLTARAGELREQGVETGTEASRGDPSRAIVKAARRLSADLVVIGTHGRAGTEAFWSGSVAARVIARTRVPLLLVPLKGEREPAASS